LICNLQPASPAPARLPDNHGTDDANILAANMGASDSKLVFKKGIFRLSEERHIPATDAYWASVSDLFLAFVYELIALTTTVLGAARVF
jgi:hypothetical protein